MTTVAPARRCAYDILRRIETEAAYSSVLLAGLDNDLRDNDRALCHELVLGTLRRRLWLNRALEHFAHRRIEDLDLPVRLALEIGLYQLRFLTRIPASAAVNESVNLVRSARLKSAVSFVNAVLRRATQEPNYDPAASIADERERTAVETSHPPWLIERWANAFGFAEAQKFAAANNQQPPLAFRFTARSSEKEVRVHILSDITAAGGKVNPSAITPDAWRVVGAGGVIRQLASKGLIYLQDEASQMVAHLLDVREDDRVLDIAAAPGSKASHLAAIVPRSTIIGGDLHEHRVRTMRDLALTQGARIEFLVHDGTQPLPFPGQSFNRVLLDVPCSGTGTLRHNPEIRWRLEPDDITDLSAKQTAMLANAAPLVRPGGRLLYSTCSVEREENEIVTDTFVSNHPDFKRIRLDASLNLQTESGEIRTWPHREDVDGFFISAFERGG